MRTFMILALCGLTLLGLRSAAAGQAKEKEARQSAEAWLALVDAEKYGESWDEAASLFKDKVTRQKWEQMAGSVRKPLGELQSREFLGAHYATELPGVPDGEYVVIQYKASYENKKSAVETVTPMLDKDGKWRVSGYFIR